MLEQKEPPRKVKGENMSNVSLIYLGNDWDLTVRNTLRVFMGVSKEKLEGTKTFMEIGKVKCRL